MSDTQERLRKLVEKVADKPVPSDPDESLFESGMLDSFLLPDLIGPIVYRREIKQLAGQFLAEYRTDRRYVELSAPEQERYERIWATIWLAVRSYTPDRAFSGDVHQFRATTPQFGMADVASGWDRRIIGRVLVHSVPGRHSTFMEDPRSGKIIRAVLDTVMPPPVPPPPKDQLRG